MRDVLRLLYVFSLVGTRARAICARVRAGSFCRKKKGTSRRASLLG